MGMVKCMVRQVRGEDWCSLEDRLEVRVNLALKYNCWCAAPNLYSVKKKLEEYMGRKLVNSKSYLLVEYVEFHSSRVNYSCFVLKEMCYIHML